MKRSFSIFIFSDLCTGILHCFLYINGFKLKDFLENNFLPSIRTDSYWVSLIVGLILKSIAGGM